MRFLILSLFAFASVASAQDCPNGRCQQPARVIRTQTVYEYPQQQPTRYTLQAVPVPVTVYYAEPVTYRPATVYYRVERRGFRLFR
jgi:hypothetical protein